MMRIVTNENTLLYPKFKLMFVIMPKTRKVRATKHSYNAIVKLSMKKSEIRCLIVNDKCRHPIDKVKAFYQKVKGNLA